MHMGSLPVKLRRFPQSNLLPQPTRQQHVPNSLLELTGHHHLHVNGGKQSWTTALLCPQPLEAHSLSLCLKE